MSIVAHLCKRREERGTGNSREAAESRRDAGGTRRLPERVKTEKRWSEIHRALTRGVRKRWRSQEPERAERKGLRSEDLSYRAEAGI